MSEAAEQQTEQKTETAELNESEVRAKRLGWVPKDEFRGDAENWRSAEEFLTRGERLLPLLQRDNDKLHKRLSDMELQLKETREASKELLEFTSKSEQRAYERARKEIETKITEAASQADTATVRQEMQNLDALNKQHEKPAPKTETKTNGDARDQLDPVIQDWISRESWFNPKNAALYGFATEAYAEIDREHPGMSTEDKLAETKKRTVDMFPTKFGVNQKRNGKSSVSEPNSGGDAPRKKGKTYDDLPDDAKKACDKFVKTIKVYTREQYVKDYDWS